MVKRTFTEAHFFKFYLTIQSHGISCRVGGKAGLAGDCAALHLGRAGVSAGSRLPLTAFPHSRYDLLVALYGLTRLIEILHIQHGGTNEQ